MSEEKLNEAMQYNLDYTEAMLNDELFGTNEVAEVKLLASEKAIEDLQQKVEQLENIRKEAREYIKKNLTIGSILDGKKTYCLNSYSFDYEDLLNILNKGSENDVKKDNTNNN